MQIQYVTNYAYGEKIAVLSEPSGDRLSLSRNCAGFVDWLTDRSAPWERLKPHIFVSSPPRGDASVVRVIQEVLSSLSDRVVVTSWEKIDYESGITLQVAERIALSRFGICYLSEPTDNAATGPRYIDNANVVFEAGMVHALTNTPDAEPSGWIPIREEIRRQRRSISPPSALCMFRVNRMVGCWTRCDFAESSLSE